LIDRAVRALLKFSFVQFALFVVPLPFGFPFSFRVFRVFRGKRFLIFDGISPLRSGGVFVYNQGRHSS
jgi:hypothetical protein